MKIAADPRRDGGDGSFRHDQLRSARGAGAASDELSVLELSVDVLDDDESELGAADWSAGVTAPALDESVEAGAAEVPSLVLLGTLIASPLMLPAGAACVDVSVDGAVLVSLDWAQATPNTAAIAAEAAVTINFF